MNASKLVFSDDGDNFRIISVDNQQDVLVVYVQITTQSAVCPNCCITSKRIHSYYTRKIADLPVFGKTSRIILRPRKFYCHQDECPFKIFTERFESHFRPYKRRTERLESKIRQLGLLAGGRPAQRICTILSIPTSDTTILRLIEKSDFSPAKGVTAIGVDDWAYKKRKSYGSILVNLHTGKVIDLLPDREQETLRKWLQERPEIEVMSRDRYSNYQKAITLGAPQSIQVTDRWHLLKNLSEAVQKVLIRHYSKATALLANKQLRVDDQQIAENQSTLYENRSSPDSAHGGIRLKRFEQLKELQKKGYSIRAMARHLCMHRQTVKNYLDMETLPRKSQCKINPLEKFFTHIKKRMEEEPSILITTLWQELRTQGYKGAYSTFSEGLKFYGIRVGKKAGFTKELPNHGAASFKPSSAAIWFLSDQQNLWDDQRNIIRELCKSSKELNKTFILVQSFRKIMAEKSGDTKLREWIEKSSTSGLKEIASFAKGLLADCPAVENALTLPWSNGPVEGNVNRLKMIKRQMYGRAGFDLLRKRVVYAPS